MRNVILEMKDKLLLRKRSVIETINDELKIFVQLNIRATVPLEISLQI